MRRPRLTSETTMPAAKLRAPTNKRSSNPRPPAAEMELASGISNRRQLLLKYSAGPQPLGKQWCGPGPVSAERRGNVVKPPRGLALAALGGGRLLDRRLRRLMRLDRAHLVGAMVAN